MIIKRSATVGWACKLLWCFCSWMGDAICKVNCSWRGRLHECVTWAIFQGPMLCLMLYCCCLEVLNNFWTKTSVFLLFTWSCKLCWGSWVAAPTWRSSMQWKGHELWSWQLGFKSQFCNFPAVWVWVGYLTSLSFSVLISKMVTIISDFCNCWDH